MSKPIYLDIPWLTRGTNSPSKGIYLQTPRDPEVLHNIEMCAKDVVRYCMRDGAPYICLRLNRAVDSHNQYASPGRKLGYATADSTVLLDIAISFRDNPPKSVFTSGYEIADAHVISLDSEKAVIRYACADAPNGYADYEIRSFLYESDIAASVTRCLYSSFYDFKDRNELEELMRKLFQHDVVNTDAWNSASEIVRNARNADHPYVFNSYDMVAMGGLTAPPPLPDSSIYKAFSSYRVRMKPVGIFNVKDLSNEYLMKTFAVDKDTAERAIERWTEESACYINKLYKLGIVCAYKYSVACIKQSTILARLQRSGLK